MSEGVALIISVQEVCGYSLVVVDFINISWVGVLEYYELPCEKNTHNVA